MIYYIVEKWEEDIFCYNNPYQLIGYELFDNMDKAKSFIDKQEKNKGISYETEEVKLNVD